MSATSPLDQKILSENLIRTLDEQTLGLRNRITRKMFFYYKPYTPIEAEKDENDENLENNQKAAENSPSLESSVVVSSHVPVRNPIFEPPSPQTKEEQTEKSSYSTQFKRYVNSMFGYFSKDEQLFVRNSVPQILFSGIKLPLGALTAFSFLSNLATASASPIQNYSFVEGSPNCDLIPLDKTHPWRPFSNCQQFSVINTGKKIISGFIVKGYGIWDEDAPANLPDNVCQEIYDSCYSYPVVKQRFQWVMSHENATKLIGVGPFCKNVNPGPCLTTSSFQGLTPKGCYQFLDADPAKGGYGYFSQCAREVEETLKRQINLRNGMYASIAMAGFGVLAFASCKIHKKRAAKRKAREEQEKIRAEQEKVLQEEREMRALIVEQRRDLHREQLAAATHIMCQTQGLPDLNGDTGIPPVPNVILKNILDFNFVDDSQTNLSDIVIREANQIHQQKGVFSPLYRAKLKNEAQPQQPSDIILEMPIEGPTIDLPPSSRGFC